MPPLDPTPLIQPAETVHVDTGRLHTVVQTVRRAFYWDEEPLRREIVTAAGLLKESLVVPLVLEQPTVEVFAEPLWWVTYAADQHGIDHDLPPIGGLFTAVDHLQDELSIQAPRTDRALAAALEAEYLLMLAEHTEASDE